MRRRGGVATWLEIAEYEQGSEYRLARAS